MPRLCSRLTPHLAPGHCYAVLWLRIPGLASSRRGSAGSPCSEFGANNPGRPRLQARHGAHGRSSETVGPRTTNAEPLASWFAVRRQAWTITCPAFRTSRRRSPGWEILASRTHGCDGMPMNSRTKRHSWPQSLSACHRPVRDNAGQGADTARASSGSPDNLPIKSHSAARISNRSNLASTSVMTRLP